VELDQIRTFLAVARLGSVSRAAREIYRSQPAVSLKLAALETELGVRLLERRARGVALTPAGEIVRRRGEALLGAVETLRTELDDLSAHRAGHVTLGASDTVCLYTLPRVLKEFAGRYPGIELRLVTQISRQVLELIEADQVDLGIVGLPVDIARVHVRARFQHPFVVVFPPGHRFDGRSWLRPEELRGHPLVHLRRDTFTRIWIDRILAPFGLEAQVRMEVSTIEVIKKLVEVGLGLSILPRVAIAEELRFGRLRAARLRGVELTRELGLVHREGKYFSRAVETMAEALERTLPGTRRAGPGAGSTRGVAAAVDLSRQDRPNRRLR